MSSRNTKSNNSNSPRLRSSNTTANKASKKSQNSPKSAVERKQSLKKLPNKTYDVEPIKRRLRSSGNYKFSSPFEKPHRSNKLTPMSPSNSKVLSSKKTTSKLNKQMLAQVTPVAKSKNMTNLTLTKREQFFPETRTPSPISQRLKKLIDKPACSLNLSSQKASSSNRQSDQKPSTPKKAVFKLKKEVESNAQGQATGSRRKSACIKLELPEGSQSSGLSKIPRGSTRLFEPDTPPVRNQNSFYNCVVCKESTLLLTAAYKEQLTKNELKNIELSTEDLTLTEDPALQCNSCKKHFHLVCVYDELQLQNWAVSNPKSFLCQECIRCSRCSEPIFDPGNVQCITCGNAFHEICKPDTQTTHDFPSLSRVWYCNLCEENLLKIFDFKSSKALKLTESAVESDFAEQSVSKRPNKRKLNQSHNLAVSKKIIQFRRPYNKQNLSKSFDCPIPKKNRLDANDTLSPRTLRRISSRVNPDPVLSKSVSPTKLAKLFPIKIESPSRSNRNKEITDEEQEKRRLSTLNRLKESIRYNGEYQCIAAQESTFSRLNEEYVNEEEELNEPQIEHFIPFASLNVSPSKRNDYSEATFFYGPIAYRPRFSQFLRTIFLDYERLSFCRRCLMALPSPSSLIEHNSACTVKHPPGTLIYQEKNISVWEVVGKKEKTYSRRLALFAKIFIGSKTVFFEVEQFNFYVLTETEGDASIMAGYFSKEIKPTGNNNLSCLLILPWMQRKGYGLFLIDLSYHLSLRERKIGSPEHPLSDAGLKTYRQYWYGVIMSYLREKIYQNEKIDLIELKESRGIELRDILETLMIADMTFILDDRLQISIETPMYTMLSLLRRRYVKPKLLQVKTHAGPFTTYN